MAQGHNATSRQISSSQQDIHPRLLEMLKRHQASNWQGTHHAPSVAAFDTIETYRQSQMAGCPIVLDSGCGTGVSTRSIAAALPECWVIGIDKSDHRLQRGGARQFPHHEGRVSWLRAELTTFWRLALAAGWELSHHFLLYPNPWPKPGHLQRRWHGHPVFPQLLQLGGLLELRTNWRLYAQEFAFSLEQMEVPMVQQWECSPVSDGGLAETQVTSPFEKKYRESGHSLYGVAAELP